MIPNIDIEPELTIPLGDDRSLTVHTRLVPSPEWFALCETAKGDDGNIVYSDHAEAFISAGVVRIGDDQTDPAPLDPGDAEQIANYPQFVVHRILGQIVRTNTVGVSTPKG